MVSLITAPRHTHTLTHTPLISCTQQLAPLRVRNLDVLTRAWWQPHVIGSTFPCWSSLAGSLPQVDDTLADAVVSRIP